MCSFPGFLFEITSYDSVMKLKGYAENNVVCISSLATVSKNVTSLTSRLTQHCFDQNVSFRTKRKTDD